MTALADMTVLSRCELCDTPLEYMLLGTRFRFTGHSPELCRVGTLERIRNLEAALKAKDELYQHAAAQFVRQVDELLTGHGLATLAQRAETNEVRRLMALETKMEPSAVRLAFGIGPGPGEMLRARGVDPESLAADQKPGSRR